MGLGARPVILPVTAPRNRAREYLATLYILIKGVEDRDRSCKPILVWQNFKRSYRTSYTPLIGPKKQLYPSREFKRRPWPSLGSGNVIGYGFLGAFTLG